MVNYRGNRGRTGEFLFAGSSYLRFKLTNSGASASNANNTKLDGHASCVISKLEIFQGSVLLESIDQYNVLHAMLNDVQVPYNNKIGVQDLISGGGTSETNSAQTVIEEGQGLAENNGSAFFSFPLVSALLGTMAEKAVPLSYMSSDIRLELTLAAQNDAFVTGTAPSIQVSDISFEASIKQLDPSVDQAILGAAEGGTLSWHSSSWRQYTHSLVSGETAATVLIPARFSSLRNMIHCFRPSANVGNLAKRSIKSRERAALTSYQYRVGNEMYPAKPIVVGTDGTQVVPEVLKAFNMYDGAVEHGIAFTNTDLYFKSDCSADDTDGQFLFGIDMGSFEQGADLMNAGKLLALVVA